jgi:hypothetical protein
VLANPPFFLWIGGEIPAEGLVEEGAIEVEAGFDQVTIGGSRRDRPVVVGKEGRQHTQGNGPPGAPDRSGQGCLQLRCR